METSTNKRPTDHELIRERTMAGLKSARARGRKGGREFSLLKAQVRLFRSLWRTATPSLSELCGELSIKPVTLYRYVGPEGQLRGLCCKVRVIGELFALGDARGWRMNDFKGRHFEGEIVLWAVRWYCRYPISYRDLETMMTERGVAVDHSTIYRWVQRFAPEMEKRLRWQWRRARAGSWRVDETYVRVRGKWAYLYRAVDKFGDTIDFYLSATRNTKAAKRFLGKALRGWKADLLGTARRTRGTGK